MWLLLAEVNLRGGERLTGSTAVLQATCVDATIIPYLEQRLNFTMGCYGCREATDIAARGDRGRLPRRAPGPARRQPRCSSARRRCRARAPSALMRRYVTGRTPADDEPSPFQRKDAA